MSIDRGDVVEATTASGSVVRMRALGGPAQGHDFPIVWLCTEEAWQRAAANAQDPSGLPWPLDAIHQLIAG